MTDDNALYDIAEALRSISRGTYDNPSGLDGIAMGISGGEGHTTLAEAVLSVSASLDNIAEALERIATVQEKSTK